MIIALDTETTGLDFAHGCAPFLVTITTDEDESIYWEWDVTPETRQPVIPKGDVKEIREYLTDASAIVFHNAKFDLRALDKIGISPRRLWPKVRDTLLAAHLVDSSQELKLKNLCLTYLSRSIDRQEERLKNACVAARREAKKLGWPLAGRDNPLTPSAKDTVWKYDMWLPRQVADELDFEESHEWRTILADYANHDSASTLAIYSQLRGIIADEKLEALYEERLKLLPIIYGMESRGITYSHSRLEELKEQYGVEEAKAGAKCEEIAKGCGLELTMPKGANNNSLLDFAEHEKGLDLPTLIGAVKPDNAEAGYSYGKGGSKAVKDGSLIGKSGRISLSKPSLDYYESLLAGTEDTYKLEFLANLRNRRKRGTARSYMEGYDKMSLPYYEERALPFGADWRVLYPSLNPTGTATLRFSSQNPNEQNISKQEGFNLRYLFGPAPGREWWSLDYENLELKIPAYEAEEQEMIDLFEQPEEPPFFGSYHLLVASVLHPKLWADCQRNGESFKKVYLSSWYQWVKNGNFAVQYGAVEQSGTADRAYHLPGAQRKIQSRFKNITLLNRKMIQHAEDYGFVETIPDRDIGRGYPIAVPRNAWGRIRPTVPLNYHVQGTAMWVMCKAMTRVSDYLQSLGDMREDSDYVMVMQIHDEIVFDFPAVGRRGYRGNLPKIRKIKRLMEQSGDDIGIPLSVSVEYHPNNWSEGERIAA